MTTRHNQKQIEESKEMASHSTFIAIATIIAIIMILVEIVRIIV